MADEMTVGAALPATIAANIRSVLAQGNPRQTTALVMASLPQSLRRALTPVYLYGASGPRLDSYRIDGAVDLREIQTALAVLVASTQPASAETILDALTELRLTTRGRDLSEEELELQTVIYAKRLSARPADIVLAVLREWPDCSAWWPTWHELSEQLDNASSERSALRFALERALASSQPGSRPDLVEPPRPQRTASARATEERSATQGRLARA